MLQLDDRKRPVSKQNRVGRCVIFVWKLRVIGKCKLQQSMRLWSLEFEVATKWQTKICKPYFQELFCHESSPPPFLDLKKIFSKLTIYVRGGLQVFNFLQLPLSIQSFIHRSTLKTKCFPKGNSEATVAVTDNFLTLLFGRMVASNSYQTHHT